jgi:hypothetical protein
VEAFMLRIVITFLTVANLVLSNVVFATNDNERFRSIVETASISSKHENVFISDTQRIDKTMNAKYVLRQ